MATKEGFWRVKYGTAAGAGIALLVFDTNEIYGADTGGGRYRGAYDVDEGSGVLNYRVRFTAIEPTNLVQGGQPVSEGFTFEIAGSLPRDGGEDRVVVVQTSLGPVNAVFTRIDNLPG